MAKPTAIIVGDTFLDWRTRYNTLLAMVPEVVESAATSPTAADDTYEVSTFWIRLDTNESWQLVHTTGAADSIWMPLGVGLANIIEDTTPQLGGDLDTLGNSIWDTSTQMIYIGDGAANTGGKADFIDITSYAAALAQATASMSAENDTNAGTFAVDSNYQFVKTLFGQVYNPLALKGDAYIAGTGSIRLTSPIIEIDGTESIIIGPNADIRIQSDPSNQKQIRLQAGGHLDLRSGCLTESTFTGNYDINLQTGRNINLNPHQGDVRVNGDIVLTQADTLDADTLNGQAGAYYLARSNHTGFVETEDIRTLAVTTDRLAALAVTSAKIAANNVGNDKLIDMAAYSLKLRNNAAVGDPQDVKISAIAEKASPTTGDWILGKNSSGVLAKYDVGNIGGGIQWFYKTASDTIVAGQGWVMWSAGVARTVTMPATLVVGDEFIIHHTDADANNVLLTIADNGHNIQYMGVNYTANVTLEKGETIHLVATSANVLQIV